MAEANEIANQLAVARIAMAKANQLAVAQEATLHQANNLAAQHKQTASTNFNLYRNIKAKYRVLLNAEQEKLDDVNDDVFFNSLHHPTQEQQPKEEQTGNERKEEKRNEEPKEQQDHNDNTRNSVAKVGYVNVCSYLNPKL